MVRFDKAIERKPACFSESIRAPSLSRLASAVSVADHGVLFRTLSLQSDQRFTLDFLRVQVLVETIASLRALRDGLSLNLHIGQSPFKLSPWKFETLSDDGIVTFKLDLEDGPVKLAPRQSCEVYWSAAKFAHDVLCKPDTGVRVMLFGIVERDLQ